MASDVILASVPKDRAGAAAAVSETAYELGMALGIATLGSIVTSVYRGFVVPPGIPPAVASHARDSLSAAVHAAETLPADQSDALLTVAKDAFTSGLAIASGVGSALMLIAAVAVWILLRPGYQARRGRHAARSRRASRCRRRRAALMLRVEPNWAIDTVMAAPALRVVGDAGALLPEDQQAVPRQRGVLEAAPRRARCRRRPPSRPASAANASSSAVVSWWRSRW